MSVGLSDGIIIGSFGLKAYANNPIHLGFVMTLLIAMISTLIFVASDNIIG